MAEVQELRRGDVFLEESQLWRVLNHEHIKMGRGSAAPAGLGALSCLRPYAAGWQGVRTGKYATSWRWRRIGNRNSEYMRPQRQGAAGGAPCVRCCRAA